MEHFFSQIQVKTKKKRKTVFTKKGNLFSPNSNGHLRSDAHQSQTIGEDADVHHTVLKLLGRIQPNYLKEYIPHPPPPPGFGTPVGNERLLLAYC